MFQILVTFFSLLSLPAMAMEVEHEAYVRTKHFSLKKENVVLSKLTSATHFMGEHFIILDGKNESPVEFNQGEKSIKAATVYYSLMSTRDYFVQQMKSEYVRDLKPIKVRIDISNDFSDVAHFTHDDYNPKFNNALTIVPSKPVNLREGIEPWFYEIWYRPAKEKTRKSTTYMVFDQLDGSEVQENILQGIFQGEVISLTQQALYNQDFSNFNWDYHLQTLAVSFGMVYILPKVFKLATKKMKTTYYLDTASLPEVSLHEFTHIALSDFLPPKRKTPVIEGLANFFAGKIQNRAKWGHRAHGHAKKMAGKNAKGLVWYETKLELEALSTSDFVYKLLWQIDEALGEKGVAVIYQTRKHLSSSSNIKEDLTAALFKSADELYPLSKDILRLKMQKIFQGLGI